MVSTGVARKNAIFAIPFEGCQALESEKQKNYQCSTCVHWKTLINSQAMLWGLHSARWGCTQYKVTFVWLALGSRYHFTFVYKQGKLERDFQIVFGYWGALTKTHFAVICIYFGSRRQGPNEPCSTDDEHGKLLFSNRQRQASCICCAVVAHQKLCLHRTPFDGTGESFHFQKRAHPLSTEWTDLTIPVRSE